MNAYNNCDSNKHRDQFARCASRVSAIFLMALCCGCPPKPPTQLEQLRGVPVGWIRVEATADLDDKERFGQDDADAIRQSVPTVSMLVTEWEAYDVAEIQGTETRVHLACTGPEYFQLLQDAMDIELIRGRFLTKQDVQTSAQVVVLDEVLALKLFPNQQPVGRTISIGKLSLHIVGVVRTDRNSFFNEILRDVYAPTGTCNTEVLDAEQLSQTELDRIWVRVNSHGDVDATQEVIKELLKKRLPETELSVR